MKITEIPFIKLVGIEENRKGRAMIQVDVEIRDINNICTCQSTFTWFIQKI